MAARGAMNTYLNVVAFTINVVITFLVGNGIPGTQSNEVLSSKYQTLVTPVGWAFSIWAIIFGSQLVFTIVQTHPSFRGHRLVQDGVGYSYIGVCLAQATWGLVFGFEIINLSVAFMLLILYFLVRIVMNQDKVDRDDAHINRDFFLFVFPFRIHCGWIVAASLVNINLVLVKNTASATAQFYTALVSLGCLLVIALTCLFASVSTDYVIPCVLAWAAVSFPNNSVEIQPPSPSYQTFSTHTTFFIRTHIYTHIVGYSRRAWYSQRSYTSYI